jgi:hypothetical protein
MSEATGTWEEIKSTIEGALREAEKLKTRIAESAGDINFDMSRIRSAFNCQAPGTETLSAEQIVVEHAVLQVKSALSCTNPETSEQEEVIDSVRVRDGDFESSAEVQTPQLQETDSPSELDNQEEHDIQVVEPLKSVPDLLDLSEAQTPQLQETESPSEQDDQEHEIQVAEPAKPVSDLLDLSEVKTPQLQETDLPAEHDDQQQHEIQLLEPAKAVPDLLDLSDMSANCEKVPNTSSEAPDLLDLSGPAVTVQEPLAQEEPADSLNTQPVDLMDIADPTLGRTHPQIVASPAVHALADLLDFAEERPLESQEVKGLEQKSPPVLIFPEDLHSSAEEAVH